MAHFNIRWSQCVSYSVQTLLDFAFTLCVFTIYTDWFPCNNVFGTTAYLLILQNFRIKIYIIFVVVY